MKEIKEFRTKTSKTFLSDDGVYRTVEKVEPIHFSSDGVMKEIDTAPSVVSDDIIEYNARPTDVTIRKDSFCGTLVLIHNDFEITVDIIPVFEDVSSVVNNNIKVENTDANKSTTRQDVASSMTWGYTVENNRIKVESEITDLDPLPSHFQFVIKHSNVNAKLSDSDITEVIKEEGEVVERNEYSRRIDFTHDKNTVLSLDAPVFIANDDEFREKPLKFKRFDDSKIVGTFSLPSRAWLEEKIQLGDIILDPTFTDSGNSVSDGNFYNHYVPKNDSSITGVEVLSAQIRWRGRDRTDTNYFEDTVKKIPSGLPMQQPEEVTTDVPVPDTDYGVDSFKITVIGDWEPRDYGAVGVGASDVDGVIFSPYNNASSVGVIEHSIRKIFQSDSVAGTNITFKAVAYDAHPEFDGGQRTSDLDAILIESGDGKTAGIRSKAEKTTSTTYSTQNPRCNINGNTTFSPPESTLQDGEYSSYVDVTNKVSGGDNSFYQFIDGSNRAYFTFEYEWQYKPPTAPSNLAASIQADGTIDFSWNDNSDIEDGIRVYRTTTSSPSFPSDYTEIDTVGANTTTYTDSDPPIGTITYAVTAYNTGGESNAAFVSVTTNKPPAFTNESESPIDGATGIEFEPTLSIEVTDAEGDLMDVSFYNESDDSQIGSTQTSVADGETASVTWPGRDFETAYNWYAVVDDGNASTTSQTFMFTTTDGIPATVAVSDSTAVGELTIDWDEVTEVTSYNVYRAQSSGSVISDYTLVAEPNTPPYTDTGLDDNQQYFYRVTSENQNGESDLSAEVNATTVLPSASDVNRTIRGANVEVNWNNDTNLGELEVQRSTDGFQTVETLETGLPGNAPSFVDRGPQRSQQVEYRVVRQDGNDTAESAPVQVELPTFAEIVNPGIGRKNKPRFNAVGVPSSASSVRFYRAIGQQPVFPDEYTLLEESSTKISDFEDLDAPNDQYVTYAFTSVDSNGNESDPDIRQTFVPPQDATVVNMDEDT